MIALARDAVLRVPVAVPASDRRTPGAHAAARLPAGESVDGLTVRELAILSALPTRMSNQDIADLLLISLNTVKTHLKHIYRKLDATCRTEAVAEAQRLRLL